jgi:hypothetical protein
MGFWPVVAQSMGGCFDYVQIHIVVTEAHDIVSAGGEGNQRREIRVESLVAISREPLLWDVISGGFEVCLSSSISLFPNSDVSVQQDREIKSPRLHS